MRSPAPNLTPPPGNPRFPLFDALRALAALSVFAGHTVTGVVPLVGHPYLFRLASQLSYEGVAIFFVLSGFLLYRPFLTARLTGRAVSLRGYARRRILRIVPAFWVALSVCLLLGVVSGVDGSNWWIYYGFGQTYSFSTIGGGIGAAWTLCIEVTFYAALPLLAFVAARLAERPGPARLSLQPAGLRADVVLLVALSAASLAYRQHFSDFAHLAAASTLLGTFFWFALGMGLAVASVSPAGRAVVARLPARWPEGSWVIALLVFVVMHELQQTNSSSPGSASTHVLYGLVAFFVVAPGVFDDAAGGAVRRVLGVRLLGWVGLISYSFYLYHTIVIEQLNKAFSGLGLAARYPVVAVLGLVVSIACAAASYYAIELPLMRLRLRASF